MQAISKHIKFVMYCEMKSFLSYVYQDRDKCTDSIESVNIKRSCLFSGVFVTASKTENGDYDYNTTLVVFLSELLKLVASAFLYTYKRE